MGELKMSDYNVNICKKAVPIWLSGRENEVNTCLELKCFASQEKNNVLRVSGASFYQVFYDGVLVHFGPARKAHGYSAIDELIVPQNVTEVLIRALGYNCPTFNGVFQSSFLIAELESDGEILAATGKFGFEYFENMKHIQKTVRYSFQRQFTESWDMTKNLAKAEVAVVDPKIKFSLRDVPYADLTEYEAKPMALSGKWQMEPENRYELRYYIREPKNLVHFPLDELESHAYEDWLKIKATYKKSAPEKKIAAGSCGLWDMGLVIAGFFRLKLHSKGNTRIIFSFAEQIDKEHSLYVEEFNTIDLIEWKLSEGEWDLTCFEPYSARYIEIIVMEGEIEVEYVGMDEFAFPLSDIKTNAPDEPDLAVIYDAAVRSFRHNVIDIYMDCPSRERAGWLFDSFYTGKAERFFTGKSVVERAFLDNYVKGGERKEAPGMVNMIYPGDVVIDQFIPQWAMWYVLEICDYITQREGIADKHMFKNQIEKLVKYFEGFRNEFGLLERLDNFNFVEWSDLNNRVLDVSWPTNMLYAKMLAWAGEVYEHREWIEESEKIKQTVRDMAFDGVMFCDRAVRNGDNILENTDERSETTQYYALFLETSVPGEKTYEALRKMVIDVFTTSRYEEYPNILRSEIFMGVYLKIDVLLNMNMPDLALKEIKANFLPMAKESGTLWEHLSGYKSRNHGFASYAAVAIDKALKMKTDKS